MKFLLIINSFIKTFNLKQNVKLGYFAILISVANLILFYIPFFKCCIQNLDYESWNGFYIIFNLFFLVVILNALVLYITLYLSRFVGKLLLILFFNINAVAIYFINTYSVIIDESMIGNMFNTNYSEASSFFSFTLILYIFFFGVLPSIFVYKKKLIKETFKRFFIYILSNFILIAVLVLVLVNSSAWLWINKHSTYLRSLAMPWAYIVNTYRYTYQISLENKEQILLPDAQIKDNKKSIVVLVIGESARSQNFSLYGYKKQTNPLLSKMENIKIYKANSCNTYTIAGVKCILEHKNTSDLYEILPNYLFRHGIDVIWRTTNWGEPTVKIDNYLNVFDLKLKNIATTKNIVHYDEILLDGLKEQILKSNKNKIFVVLHTSTSHGPIYSKKYPKIFEKFSPICGTAEIKKCTQDELINVYDNTIVYTDYLIANTIEILKKLEGFESSMIYISDHGESLGEDNLYMHGVPLSFAPKEQINIPFIVWKSNNNKGLKTIETASQHHIFHSVLDFLSVTSDIYDEEMSIFKD